MHIPAAGWLVGSIEVQRPTGQLHVPLQLESYPRFIRSHDGRDYDHFALTQKNGAVSYKNLFSNDDEALKRLGGMVGKQFR